MTAQRPTTSVPQPAPTGKPPTPALTAPQVLSHALVTLEQHVHLSRPPDAYYGPTELFSVLLYIAAHRTTIEQACAALATSSHANTVRGVLAPLALWR